MQQVVVTKNLEEDVVKNDIAFGRGRSGGRVGSSAGCEGCHTRMTFAEREQREKEEWETEVDPEEKREKGRRRRSSRWELYRCTRGWTRKSDKFDSVKRRVDFDHEIARRSSIGLVLGYAEGAQRTHGGLNNVEGRAREADRLCGDQRDQDDGAGGSRSPPAEIVRPYPSVNRGSSGRDSFGK